MHSLGWTMLGFATIVPRSAYGPAVSSQYHWRLFVLQGSLLMLLVLCQGQDMSNLSGEHFLPPSNLPQSFGNAHKFNPLPGISVGGHCRWEVKLDTVYDRIPRTITEIFCRNPYEMCGGNSNYQCRQISAKMVVAYNDPSSPSLVYQNKTVSIGCACVFSGSNFLPNYFQAPSERKRSGPRTRLPPHSQAPNRSHPQEAPMSLSRPKASEYRYNPYIYFGGPNGRIEADEERRPKERQAEDDDDEEEDERLMDQLSWEH